MNGITEADIETFARVLTELGPHPGGIVFASGELRRDVPPEHTEQPIP